MHQNQKTMKNFLILPILLFSMSITYSQDIAPQRELGIVFQNLDNFGLSFRYGSNNNYLRLNTIFLGGSSLKVEDNRPNQYPEDIDIKDFGFKAAAGYEHRIPFVDKVDFRIGFDFSYAYKQSIESNPNSSEGFPETITKVHSPGINMVLGFNYNFNEIFFVGCELLPGISHSKMTIENDNGTDKPIETYKKESLDYGLSNSSVHLILGFSF